MAASIPAVVYVKSTLHVTEVALVTTVTYLDSPFTIILSPTEH